MKNKYFIFIAVALVVSICVNLFFILQKNTDSLGSSPNLEAQIKKYPLISKRILAELPNDFLVNFVDLRNMLRKEVAPYSNTFAFYFEYLPTGVSIGVNEKDEFTAASLLKVPVVMANLLQAEIEGKDSMPNEIKLTKEMLNPNFGSLYKRGEGTIITRDEAIKYALEESDNTAINALISITNYDYFQRVNDGLDIEIKDVQETPVINVKNYSSILRSLFFASILNKDDSQLVLNHLSKSIFKDKLRAGVPDEVTIANKIGEIPNQLYTDCGIIYVPRRPYLLCMLSVSDNETSVKRMSKLSKMIYDFVSGVNINSTPSAKQ